MKIQIYHDNDLDHFQLIIKNYVKEKLKLFFNDKLDYNLEDEDDLIILRGLLNNLMNDMVVDNIIETWNFYPDCFNLFKDGDKIYYFSITINKDIHLSFLIKTDQWILNLDANSLKRLFEQEL